MYGSRNEVVVHWSLLLRYQDKKFLERIILVMRRPGLATPHTPNRYRVFPTAANMTQNTVK